MSTYNARVPTDQQYQMNMECRSSDFTDYQWCKERRIHPGTFYNEMLNSQYFDNYGGVVMSG